MKVMIRLIFFIYFIYDLSLSGIGGRKRLNEEEFRVAEVMEKNMSADLLLVR